MSRSGKTGSKAERDALRQEMLVGGCSLDLIASEMERRWGFRPREAYRHAHGWSQDEVAARFTEVAERLGGERARTAEGPATVPSVPMIGTRIGEYERWPHGGRRPSGYVLAVLAAVLGTGIEQLLDYDDHRHMPDQERTVLAAALAAATPPVPPARWAPAWPSPATDVSRRPNSGAGGDTTPRGRADLRAVTAAPAGGADPIGQTDAARGAGRNVAGGETTAGAPRPAESRAGAVPAPAGSDDAGSPAAAGVGGAGGRAAWGSASDAPSRAGAARQGDSAKDARRSAAKGTDTTTVDRSGRSGTAGATVRRGTAADDDLRAGTAGGPRRDRADIPATEGPATRADEGVEVPAAAPARRARATRPADPASAETQDSAGTTDQEPSGGPVRSSTTGEHIAAITADAQAVLRLRAPDGTQTEADTPPGAYAAPTPDDLLPQPVQRPAPPTGAEAPLITVTLDPAAPDAASAARRYRRERLLSAAPDNLRTEEEVIMDAAGQSAEFGEWAEATNVGATTLEQLDEDVRRIARGYLHHAPLPLMLDTLRLRNRVFTLLEGRQHPDQTRHLYVIAARLCGLLAWMAGDVGRHADAEAQARTGWLCGDLAGADGPRAWIRATQSKVAFWDGRVRDSARLAEDGLRFAAADSLRVLLASLGARAWARLGDTDEARAWLRRAEEEHQRADADEVGGLVGFSEAQQSYLAGTTHLYLREPGEALRAADRAVWLFQVGDQTERFYGAEMLALIDAATAHLQQAEFEGATEKLAPVLALPREQRLETFTQRLAEMRGVLRRSRHATSRSSIELQQKIEEFRAGALGQYLSR